MDRRHSIFWPSSSVSFDFKQVCLVSVSEWVCGSKPWSYTCQWGTQQKITRHCECLSTSSPVSSLPCPVVGSGISSPASSLPPLVVIVVAVALDWLTLAHPLIFHSCTTPMISLAFWTSDRNAGFAWFTYTTYTSGWLHSVSNSTSGRSIFRGGKRTHLNAKIFRTTIKLAARCNFLLCAWTSISFISSSKEENNTSLERIPSHLFRFVCQRINP